MSLRFVNSQILRLQFQTSVRPGQLTQISPFTSMGLEHVVNKGTGPG